MLHIYAAFHEKTRREISANIKAALAAAKARGVRLGAKAVGVGCGYLYPLAAFCAPKGPSWLRAYALTRSHRRPRRVPPRRHRAKSQNHGVATRKGHIESVCPPIADIGADIADGSEVPSAASCTAANSI